MALVADFFVRLRVAIVAISIPKGLIIIILLASVLEFDSCIQSGEAFECIHDNVTPAAEFFHVRAEAESVG